MDRALTMRYLWLASIPLLTVGLWAEWQSFVHLWYDSIVYNHGFLVLGGVFFLLYQRRKTLADLKVTGSPLGLFLLAGATATLILSQAADIRVFRLMLAPMIILFWGWSIWGKGFVTTAGGPILLLIFAVPIWDDFSPLLQHITVFFNTILLQAFDIPATIHEFYIILDVGTFLVENGCSGVRYLMVALFLAAFYGQLYYRSNTRIALLIVIAGLLSMVANWIRVFGIIAAGHYTDMETSLIEDHELFGWVIFVIVTLVPLFFISGKLEQPASDSENTSSNHKPETGQAHAKYPSIKWPLAASLLLLLPPLLPAALDARTERMASSWAPGLPTPDSDWSGPLRHANIWQPDFAKPDIDLSGTYVSDDLKQVQLQITGYRRQAQNKELIGYRNQLFDQKEWKLVSKTSRTLNSSGSGSPDTLTETVIQKNTDSSYVILWSWYQIGEELTNSRIEVKIKGALNKLQGDARGALWALAGRCEGVSEGEKKPDCSSQRATFERFLEDVQR
ncbi:exosortase A [Marinobacter sp. SS13-12]|uniref:exosortase A n=1 Tax=Marinobacter sp. SS13-12 TaxID=3050451 RepID=UPI002552B3FD|nr:exosortase A [Marinobacter sp. SS13-12]MDK8464281.1 EpsI family protein [Marinobacter sp. SS13-12]